MSLSYPSDASSYYSYAAAIAQVGARLNIAEHWPVPTLPESPTAGDTARYMEQLQQLYAALLVVSAEVALDRLPYTEVTLGRSGNGTERLSEVLPNRLFRRRPDKGLIYVKAGGFTYDLSEIQDMRTWEHMQHSPFLSLPLVAVDPGYTRLYVLRASEGVLRYAPEPTLPNIDAVGTERFPLYGSDAEAVFELTAAYAAGVRGGDTAIQNMHYMLSNLHKPA